MRREPLVANAVLFYRLDVLDDLSEQPKPDTAELPQIADEIFSPSAPNVKDHDPSIV